MKTVTTKKLSELGFRELQSGTFVFHHLALLPCNEYGFMANDKVRHQWISTEEELIQFLITTV